MNTLVCAATPTTGPYAGYWICGREPGHPPGLHLDIGERGAWNTDPSTRDLGGRLGAAITGVVAAALVQAANERGIGAGLGWDCLHPRLAAEIEARAVQLAAAELGVPEGVLS